MKEELSGSLLLQKAEPIKIVWKSSEYRISGGTEIWCYKKMSTYIDKALPQEVEPVTNSEYRNLNNSVRCDQCDQLNGGYTKTFTTLTSLPTKYISFRWKILLTDTLSPICIEVSRIFAKDLRSSIYIKVHISYMSQRYATVKSFYRGIYLYGFFNIKVTTDGSNSISNCYTLGFGSKLKRGYFLNLNSLKVYFWKKKDYSDSTTSKKMFEN